MILPATMYCWIGMVIFFLPSNSHVGLISSPTHLGFSLFWVSLMSLLWAFHSHPYFLLGLFSNSCFPDPQFCGKYLGSEELKTKETEPLHVREGGGDCIILKQETQVSGDVTRDKKWREFKKMNTELPGCDIRRTKIIRGLLVEEVS